MNVEELTCSICLGWLKLLVDTIFVMNIIVLGKCRFKPIEILFDHPFGSRNVVTIFVKYAYCNSVVRGRPGHLTTVQNVENPNRKRLRL